MAGEGLLLRGGLVSLGCSWSGIVVDWCARRNDGWGFEGETVLLGRSSALILGRRVQCGM